MFPVVSVSDYCIANGAYCCFSKYILHTDLDADCVHRFYLSENFGTDLGWLADHIVWLSDLLCSQIAM